MKITIIEDESHSIEQIMHLIKRINNEEKRSSYHIIETHTNVLTAMEKMTFHPPDILLLDVDMPLMNGITVSKKIKEQFPFIQIIFITGYPDFALDAFEVNATDYILKPVSMKRLSQALMKCKKQEKAPQYSINFFEQLDIKKDKLPLKIKWRTKRAKEIFAYLMYFRNRFIKKELLLELFFEDPTLAKSYNLLYTTIYQIRKHIEQNNLPILIENSHDAYYVKVNNIHFDTDEWEYYYNKSRESSTSNIRYHEHLLTIYRKGFLEDEGYIWTIDLQEQFQLQWLTTVKELINHYYSQEKLQDAIQLAIQAKSIYPYCEEFYFSLMRLYNDLNYKKKVNEEYHKLKEMMLSEFNEDPSNEIQIWYKQYFKSLHEG